MSKTPTHPFKLTQKERYCLERLLVAPMTPYQISMKAWDEGLNKTHCKREWAHAPIRTLREKGRIEKVKWVHLEGWLYRITDGGQTVLRVLQQKQEEAA